MKMVTRTALANMKYHKSKNILTGIAILLTTILLFMVPSVGMSMLDIQFAAVNKLYPSYHALYRNVDEETKGELAAHRDVGTYGLRSDVGEVVSDSADTILYYMDENGLDMNKMELETGTLPEKEQEIVVQEGMLKDMGIQAGIGDEITLPWQRYLGDTKDYTTESTFRICGFLPDTESGQNNHTYAALVSESFLRREIPKEQIRYRFLFRTAGDERANVDEIEQKIQGIASDIGISEQDIRINDDYLMANYIDPSFLPIIMLIMLIVVLAGIITIYSIYYVSMAQRVQEFGRLKAIGATRRQIRQIVLREGLCVAVAAIPLGLVISTILIRPVLMYFVAAADDGSAILGTYRQIVQNHEISMYKWWLYLIAAAATLVTVYLSLLAPMRKAAKISEVEAMRYQGGQVRTKTRQGYTDLTVGRLARTSLTGNKKKSLITIVSMGATGIFVMVVATALSCVNPRESATSDIYGQYEIYLNDESGNKEHPEWEWRNAIQNNPLSAELKEQIEELEGVEKVETFTQVQGEIDLGQDDEEPAKECVLGLPESCFEELKKGIVEGDASWEELLEGDKVIVKKEMLHWYPDIQVGDEIEFRVTDGGKSETRKLQVIAIGEYRFGMGEYNYMFMAKEAADQLSDWNCTGSFQVIADADYDAALESQINSLIDGTELLEMKTWKEQLDMWTQAMRLTRGACYAFLSILSVICIMNLINTMINSIHVRKKELGMMQAIGMTNGQMLKMLQMEGIFYTMGTLLIAVVAGSALGYPVFLWMKSSGTFSVSTYHYPVTAAIIVTVTLVAIQLILTGILARSVKKESLIDRIRFSE